MISRTSGQGDRPASASAKIACTSFSVKPSHLARRMKRTRYTSDAAYLGVVPNNVWWDTGLLGQIVHTHDVRPSMRCTLPGSLTIELRHLPNCARKYTSTALISASVSVGLPPLAGIASGEPGL